MTTLLAPDGGGWNEFRQLHGDNATIDAGTTELIEILGAVGVPVVVVRRDFTIACFNRAAADVLSLAQSDIGCSPRSVAMLSGMPKLDRWCEQAINDEVPDQYDFRAADRSFVVRIAPYTRSNGQIGGTVLTFTNVTAFRASLDQAIYEREYTKAILNCVPDPLVVLDAELRAQTANRAFYSLFRVSRDALRGIALHQLGNGAFDFDRLRSQLTGLLHDGHAFQPFEAYFDLPDVARRTVMLNACELAVPGHSGRMALLSVQDISAWKEAEAVNAKLAAIVECSDDAIVTKDIEGIITSWNGGARRIFGYTADEAVGKPITLLIPSDRQGEEAGILERIRRGQRVDHYETVRQCKDGSLVEISVTISPVRDVRGKIIGASKIARDITERTQAAAHAQMLAREVDHRAKNLLAVVQATVQLTHADTAPELKRAIEGRIQALSKAHTLLAKSRWTGADLRTLVTEELSPFCGGTSRADINGPNVILDPQRAQSIAVILHELTTNAVKYGALSVPAGRVRIEWARQADEQLVFLWGESGGPPVKPPARRGFGTRICEHIINGELKGQARFNWHADGLVCELDFAMTEPAAARSAQF